MSETRVLDTKHLLCPLPVIRTQDAVKAMNPGDELHICATDPGTMHDIPAWTRVHGHILVTAEEQNDGFYFVIRVS